MNLNRHYYDWQTHDFSFEDDIWFIMVYQVLSGERVLTEERQRAIREMWGFTLIFSFNDIMPWQILPVTH